MTRCRHKKLHWRWPDNPNCWSKFCNLRLFTFTTLQLTLQQRFRDWQRLPEIAQTARCRRENSSPVMTRIDGNSTIMKTYAYEIKQNLSKNNFLLLGRCHYDGIAHCFFYYHSQRLLFSSTKNNFSTTLIPLKNWDIHIEEFFVDSIYSKTIDKKNNILFLFLNRLPMCKAGHPDNSTICR